ncbi:hypothetical protein [Streptomyces sp. SS]|uniref:hypothetical protein n=1 Tax=Streptomyces sp. SS TaxID=260742 RepID=UPI0002D7FB32|nr:hypothetical protein [Streptomyces sp. SS]
MPTTALDDVTDRLAQVLRSSDADAWVDLDRRIRADLRWGRRIPAVHTWFPAAADRGPTAPELAVALCGPDGRTREAALPHVRHSPELLPLVVIRCADWAGPVRVRARAVLRAELPGLPPEALGRLTAVALRTGDRLRGDDARELLTARMRQASAADTDVLLGSGDRAVRRLAHRIAAERGLLPPARLAAIAAADHDVVVQDLCASAALAAAGDHVDETVLGPLLASRLGRVRAAGVTALRRAGRAGEAEPFLYDRSALVRACARWALRQAGTDPVPLYRAACAAGDAVPSDAPLGLAECGDRATDAETLWALTGHPRPRVRAGAVAGLRVLDAVRFQRLAPLLADDSRRVVREAARALAPWADHFPAGALLPPPKGAYEEAAQEPGTDPRPEAAPDREHRTRGRLTLRGIRSLFGHDRHRADR